MALLRKHALALLLPLAWAPAMAQQTAPSAAAAPAAATAELPPVTGREVRERLLADAEAARKAQRWADALAIYEHLLAADPRDDVAYRMQALTLTDLGAAYRADELRARWPEAFADYQRDRIEGDRVARMIGWGATYPMDPDHRDAEMQAAYDALRRLQAQPGRTRWEQTRLRMDSLTVLNALRRYEDVVREYEALQRENADLPAYVHGPAGDALLALRRPREAAVALEKAVALNPSDVDTQILLAYAYIEQERFDRALPLVHRLVQTQTPWPRREHAKTGYENWDRYDAEAAEAMMTSLAQDNARARAMLDALVRIGPRNAATQAAYGTVLYRQGLAASALERFDIALTIDPRSRDGATGRVSALLDLDRVAEARAAQAKADARFPGDVHVAQLDREVARRTGPQARVDWAQGRNRATSPLGSPFGARDRRIGAEAWSSLLGNRWRVGVLGDDTSAEFDPRTLHYRRYGIGVEYRYDRFSLRAAGYGVTSPRSDGAWTVDAGWRLSDVWSLRAGAAGNDVDTPLQARRFGIDADSVSLGASWTPSDATALDLSARRLRFSDGNARDTLSAAARWRVYTSPHLLVEGLASAERGHASRTDRPYFNPSDDAAATIGLRFDHILWRAYERHLRQRLDVHVGPYWQQGYGTRWIPSIAYRQEWRPAFGHTFEYGVSWSRPVYDGSREQRLAFETSYRWGF